MRSPRFLRPHSIQICNLPEKETNYKREPVVTSLRHVKCQGPVRDSRSGMMTLPEDQITVTIDCSDMESRFYHYAEWEEQEPKLGWTVHPDGDYIIWNDLQYSILEHELINPFREKPEFIELICQRA